MKTRPLPPRPETEALAQALLPDVLRRIDSRERRRSRARHALVGGVPLVFAAAFVFVVGVPNSQVDQESTPASGVIEPQQGRAPSSASGERAPTVECITPSTRVGPFFAPGSAQKDPQAACEAKLGVQPGTLRDAVACESTNGHVSVYPPATRCSAHDLRPWKK